MRRRRTKAEVAELIERFLENRLTYQQEWNDFVECREPDAVVDSYRKRRYDLDPLVNRPDPVDEDAVAQLRGILLNCVQLVLTDLKRHRLPTMPSVR
ncbi:MAG: hypothetical protein DMG96_14360 [Acidobacteria bacterium]|nr:MAG: hypothetical protein DMG96_14360 [Acidobacteriota bacterium]